MHDNSVDKRGRQRHAFVDEKNLMERHRPFRSGLSESRSHSADAQDYEDDCRRCGCESEPVFTNLYH